MQEYNICYSLDSNYTEQLAVSITSILKNADITDNINIYILDGGLTNGDKSKIELLKNIKDFCIEYIKVDVNDFKSCPLLVQKDDKHTDYHVTLPTYFRFKLAEFLPSLKKVLYLDCDVIIRTSLKELFSINLDSNAIALVVDADSEREAKRLDLKKYFNAGVMLINLDYWRKNNVEAKLFDYAQNNKDTILWQDQDIINVVLKKEIKEIDKVWNYQYFQYEEISNEDIGKIAILHLAGRFKPWLMPFESIIYDEYYYYLLSTAWKNNILKYKQSSAGKFLKNQIGGSVTNILVNATDEDIQKCCSSIDDNYKFIKEQLAVYEKQTDKKLSNLYEEIAKSNEFIKELDKETRYLLGKELNEKATNLYEEITKSNEFTKELDKETRYLLGKEINEKTTNLYEEIEKSNEFVKELDKETRYLLGKEINEKISEVYKEIENSYEYIKELDKEARYLFGKSTDEKIDLVYQEITRNYSYTEDLNNKNEEKIISLKNEVERNNNYAELLVEISEDKQNNRLNEVEKTFNETIQDAKTRLSALEQSYEKLQTEDKTKILAEIQEAKEKILSVEQIFEVKLSDIQKELSETKEKLTVVEDLEEASFTEKQWKILEEIFDENVSVITTDLKKETAHRYSEIYSYSNEHFARLYKGLKDTSNNFETILNDKVSSLYQNDEAIKWEVNSIKENLNVSLALNNVVSSLKQELLNQKNTNDKKFRELQKEYEDRLNQQRIKYENKLMNLEQIIKENKKNPLVKLIEKIKKR